jgi:hypothetical protein
MIRITPPRQVNATWRMSPSVSPTRPEALFAVVAAAVVPDQDQLGENLGGIVETDAAFAQRPGVFASSQSIPIPSEILRL